MPSSQQPVSFCGVAEHWTPWNDVTRPYEHEKLSMSVWLGSSSNDGEFLSV